jgi:hypothetical protein
LGSDPNPQQHTNVRFASLADIETLSPMSALPPKADMVQHDRDVRFVPKADMTAILVSVRLAAQQ